MEIPYYNRIIADSKIGTPATQLLGCSLSVGDP